jgi:hypothetical protein
MNLRNWSKHHTLGMIVGFIGPMLYIPIILFIIMKSQHFYWEQVWFKFVYNSEAQGKFISLSIIPNLGWFYFFLNREKYNIAMGVILGSALYLPYILYITLF